MSFGGQNTIFILIFLSSLQEILGLTERFQYNISGPIYHKTTGGKGFTIQLQVDWGVCELDVYSSRAIFSPSYMRTYNKNKVDIVKERAEELQDYERCYYIGEIHEKTNTWVAASDCGGRMRGVVYDERGTFKFENESSHEMIISHVDNETDIKFICGKQNPSARMGLFAYRDYKGDLYRNTEYYIEMVVVVDNHLYLALNKDETVIHDRIKLLISIVNAFLQDFSMLIMVQRVEILTSNSFDIQTESAINFTKVGTFVQKYFIGELVADNVQFLTTLPIKHTCDNTTTSVGMAIMGGMCKENSSFVVIREQLPHDYPLQTALILAYELGHNLAVADKDKEKCSCDGKICNTPNVSGKSLWRVPSSELINVMLRNNSFLCLHNDPTSIIYLKMDVLKFIGGVIVIFFILFVTWFVLAMLCPDKCGLIILDFFIMRLCLCLLRNAPAAIGRYADIFYHQVRTRHENADDEPLLNDLLNDEDLEENVRNADTLQEDLNIDPSEPKSDVEPPEATNLQSSPSETNHNAIDDHTVDLSKNEEIPISESKHGQETSPGRNLHPSGTSGSLQREVQELDRRTTELESHLELAPSAHNDLSLASRTRLSPSAPSTSSSHQNSMKRAAVPEQSLTEGTPTLEFKSKRKPSAESNLQPDSICLSPERKEEMVEPSVSGELSELESHEPSLISQSEALSFGSRLSPKREELMDGSSSGKTFRQPLHVELAPSTRDSQPTKIHLNPRKEEETGESLPSQQRSRSGSQHALSSSTQNHPPPLETHLSAERVEQLLDSSLKREGPSNESSPSQETSTPGLQTLQDSLSPDSPLVTENESNSEKKEETEQSSSSPDTFRPTSLPIFPSSQSDLQSSETHSNLVSSEQIAQPSASEVIPKRESNIERELSAQSENNLNCVSDECKPSTSGIIKHHSNIERPQSAQSGTHLSRRSKEERYTSPEDESWIKPPLPTSAKSAPEIRLCVTPESIKNIRRKRFQSAFSASSESSCPSSDPPAYSDTSSKEGIQKRISPGKSTNTSPLETHSDPERNIHPTRSLQNASSISSVCHPSPHPPTYSEISDLAITYPKRIGVLSSEIILRRIPDEPSTSHQGILQHRSHDSRRNIAHSNAGNESEFPKSSSSLEIPPSDSNCEHDTLRTSSLLPSEIDLSQHIDERVAESSSNLSIRRRRRNSRVDDLQLSETLSNLVANIYRTRSLQSQLSASSDFYHYTPPPKYEYIYGLPEWKVYDPPGLRKPYLPTPKIFDPPSLRPRQFFPDDEQSSVEALCGSSGGSRSEIVWSPTSDEEMPFSPREETFQLGPHNPRNAGNESQFAKSSSSPEIPSSRSGREHETLRTSNSLPSGIHLSQQISNEPVAESSSSQEIQRGKSTLERSTDLLQRETQSDPEGDNQTDRSLRAKAMMQSSSSKCENSQQLIPHSSLSKDVQTTESYSNQKMGVLESSLQPKSSHDLQPEPHLQSRDDTRPSSSTSSTSNTSFSETQEGVLCAENRIKTRLTSNDLQSSEIRSQERAESLSSPEQWTTTSIDPHSTETEWTPTEEEQMDSLASQEITSIPSTPLHEHSSPIIEEDTTTTVSKNVETKSLRSDSKRESSSSSDLRTLKTHEDSRSDVEKSEFSSNRKTSLKPSSSVPASLHLAQSGAQTDSTASDRTALGTEIPVSSPSEFKPSILGDSQLSGIHAAPTRHTSAIASTSQGISRPDSGYAKPTRSNSAPRITRSSKKNRRNRMKIKGSSLQTPFELERPTSSDVLPSELRASSREDVQVPVSSSNPVTPIPKSDSKPSSPAASGSQSS